MAVPVIDATVAGANANSYVTLAEATTYLELRPGGQVFLDEDQSRQRAALIFAAMLMERPVYWGRKHDFNQALQFPRTGMVEGNPAQPFIPLDVKHAQIEQGLDIVNDGYLQRLEFIDHQTLGIRQMEADDTVIRMVPFHPDGFPEYRLAPAARTLLQPYIDFVARIGRA